MKVDGATSPDVIDRRKHVVGGAAAGFLAAVLAAFGIHAATSAPDPDRDLVELVSTALDRGQEFWAAHDASYRRAKVVLFDGSTSSGCGRALTASGPFYCPPDERIYVDLAFLRSITGSLARAYVIAHELGHHVQKLGAEIEGRPSVDVELGADCYAGAWMRSEQDAGQLDAADLDGALAEAMAVGDDRICPTCSPEVWTHGSAAQRVAAVRAGFAGADCR